LLGAYVVLRDIHIGFIGIVSVICLLPFATLPVDIGLTPTFLDLALGSVVGIWLLRLVTGRQRTVATAPITIPVILFLLIAVFSFIFGLQNGPLTPTLLRRFAELLLSIGFVIVIVDYCHDWPRLNSLVKILLLAGAGASVIAIGLWLLPDQLANDLLNMLQRLGYPGGWVIRYIEENPDLSERAIGTSVDPNSLGGLLLMIGALGGPQLITKRPLFSRWLTWGIVGSIFLAILLTFSRAAMGGLAVGLAFVAVVRYRKLLPYMAGAGLLILLLPVTQGYVARAVAGLQGQDLATQMRIGEYTDALILIGRYPLFGVGFAGSPDIDIYLGVASLYLTIAQQMGLIGLLAFFVVVGTLFGYAYRQRHYFRADTQASAVWLGLHAALVGGLVAGILDHYLFNIDFHHAVTIFWFLVGLAAASSHLADQASVENSSPLP
ncbi:MAG: O-antigen ligase family protein, partial [Anaerolineales bacterium]|nr:O-antigen ligase family protein [Anaerolineales bacterium]